MDDLGAAGCILVGDPEYYKRFGFMSIPGVTYEGVPPENLLVRALKDRLPSGVVMFHPAFNTKEQT